MVFQQTLSNLLWSIDYCKSAEDLLVRAEQLKEAVMYFRI
jgi:hypothetical protein